MVKITSPASFLAVGQFEILRLRAKDQVQQKGPETVAGDAVHAPKYCEGPKNKLCPCWESIYGS
jgi:hypothetical protein